MDDVLEIPGAGRDGLNHVVRDQRDLLFLAQLGQPPGYAADEIVIHGQRDPVRGGRVPVPVGYRLHHVIAQKAGAPDDQKVAACHLPELFLQGKVDVVQIGLNHILRGLRIDCVMHGLLPVYQQVSTCLRPACVLLLPKFVHQPSGRHLYIVERNYIVFLDIPAHYTAFRQADGQR